MFEHEVQFILYFRKTTGDVPKDYLHVTVLRNTSFGTALAGLRCELPVDALSLRWPSNKGPSAGPLAPLLGLGNLHFVHSVPRHGHVLRAFGPLALLRPWLSGPHLDVRVRQLDVALLVSDRGIDPLHDGAWGWGFTPSFLGP